MQSLNAAKEGSDVQELVLLQTMLGMSTTLGVVLAGVLIRRPFVVHNFVLSTPIVSQVRGYAFECRIQQFKNYYFIFVGFSNGRRFVYTLYVLSDGLQKSVHFIGHLWRGLWWLSLLAQDVGAGES